MSPAGRGPYMNEDGDWWVAVEDANFRDARREVVSCLGYTIPDEGTLRYAGRATVRLDDEHEALWCGLSDCGRTTEAWHFVENRRW